MAFLLGDDPLCLLFPDDQDRGQGMLIGRLRSPAETYGISYGFTFQPMVDAILQAQADGAPQHFYLDRSQSRGAAEAPQVQRMVDAGVEVTIGTSTAGSRFICHTKGFVVLDYEPDGPWCWEGSINFSQGGWRQVNTAMVFRSQPFADHFLAQFRALRAYAWRSHPEWQVMPRPPADLATHSQ